MTNDRHRKTNQIIHEAMGLYWVPQPDIECPHKSFPEFCVHCQSEHKWNIGINPDYTSDWSAWGKALEWAQEQEWWGDYVVWGFSFCVQDVSFTDVLISLEYILSCERGSYLLAKFITKHPKYFKKEVSNDKK